MRHKPIIVGIYKGPAKSYNQNVFFERSLQTINRILINGGINIRKENTHRLRCFIVDTLARVFIINHRGHMFGQSCSKCKIFGSDVKDVIFFWMSIIFYGLMRNMLDVWMKLTIKMIKVL